MKQLTCEMCGSTDLMKQGGVFVCQACGCKYSVEEAKKMMIEGKVDVSGSTVKVDTTAELSNLYQIARRAKSDNDGEKAIRYYDMVLMKDPASWEAYFFLAYFRSMECKIAGIQSAAVSLSNCEDTVLKMIRTHVPEEEQEEAVAEVVRYSIHAANVLSNGAKRHFDEISSDIRYKYQQEYVDRASSARDMCYNCGTQVDRIFGDKPKIAPYAADAWKAGIKIHTALLPRFALQDANKATITSYAEKVGKYDGAYLNSYRLKIKNEKIQELQNELAALEREKRKYPTKVARVSHIVGGLCGGLMVAFGIIFMIVFPPIVIGYCMFLILLGIGFYAVPIFNESEKCARNKSIVAGIEAKCVAKRAEIEKLKKQ